MKSFSSVTIGLLLILCCTNLSVAQRYELVWSDEFDAQQLDRETWNVWRGSAFNNELQCYTDQEKNIKVQDGMLMLTAYREQVQCASLLRSYSSGRISTDTLNAGWEYGRFEIRAKMPAGTGFWPAFWLMPAKRIDWPKGGEIDILEFRGNILNETNGAIHYWRQNCVGNSATCRIIEEKTLDTGMDLSADFNIYAIEWTSDKLVWFFNDDPYFTVDLSSLSAEFDPFTGPFYIILNLAVGGSYLPNPTPTTQFPQSYIIDYVRVFQDVNEAPEVDLEQVNTRFGAGAHIQVTPSFNDPDGSVERVEYYLDGTLMQTSTDFPFSFQIDPLMEGCYNLSVVAYDNDGAPSTSEAETTLIIGEGCENNAYRYQPPTIPTLVPMWKYNHGGQNVAYFETTPLSNAGATLPDASIPRMFEAVDIRPIDHPDTEYVVFESVTGEWMRYSILSEYAGPVEISFTLLSDVNSSFDVDINGQSAGSFNRIRTSGQPVVRTLSNVNLLEGLNDIKVTTRIGNITWISMDLKPVEPVSIDRFDIPDSFELLSVYPNPFNPETTIQVELPQSAEVMIELYNVSGRQLSTIHEGILNSGQHIFRLNMQSFASGIYFIKLSTEGVVKVQPVTLLK